MTIEIENGWLQYDNQIGTFRGMKDGVLYGTFTNEITTAQALADAMGVILSAQELSELQAEKVEE